jgi:flagellar hook protein FlgE
MGGFGVPLSGLYAAQNQLNSISNNLANINTDGYKDQTSTFSDIFAQSSSLNGVGDPIQNGLGVQVAQTVSNFSDGTATATGISSNVALSGSGFFVVQGANGATSYTRSGDFTVNSEGQLSTPESELVLGYPATNGVVNTTGSLSPLVIQSGSIIPATPTTTFNVAANLDASSAVGTTFVSTIPIYDSIGTQQQLSVTYTSEGGGAWSYSAALPASALSSGSSTPLATGTLQFNADGTLTSATPITPAAGPASSTSVTMTTGAFADGSASQTITWDLTGTSGSPTITQTNSSSSTSATTQNGFASGTLTSYTIASDGTIEGTYSSGQTSALGQIALANFANPQGLQQVGGNQYLATTAAGVPLVGIAGTGGRGTMTGGYVESSNVDVATEFGKMIQAQQAYQANARSVTTMQTISQDTIQMIQGA